MTVDARFNGSCSFEELTNLFNAGGSNLSLPGLLADPDAQVQDFPFLHRLPEQHHSPLVLPPDVTESSAAATTVAPAAPADPAPPVGFPRVSSLDFLRAFLTARQGGAGGGEMAGGEAGCTVQPGSGLAAGVNNTEQPAEDDMGAGTEPACSSVTAPASALPPMPAHTAAVAAGAAGAVCAMPALVGFGAVPAVPTPGMPPAVLAAFMHSAAGCGVGLAGVPLLPVPLPVPVAPLVPANGGGRDAGMHPSLPTSTTAGGCDSGRGGSTGTFDLPAGHAAAINTAGMSKAELRRVRRMVSNRESARRSRKRKQEALDEAEGRVQATQAQLAEANAKLARLSDELARRDCEVTTLRLEVEALRARK